MAKKKKCPECEAGEKWAVPFADFFSLLLALFIALYAIAAVNTSQLKSLSVAFTNIFENNPVTLNIVPNDSKDAHDRPGQTKEEGRDMSKQTQAQAKQQQVESAKQLMKELQAVKDVVDEKGNGSDTEIVMTDEGIRIRMLNSIAFDQGSANLTPASRKVLDILSASIKNFPNDFKVEGHTSESQAGGRGSYYPTNWELSTARASVVVRYLIDKGFDPKRFQAVGYADTKPLSLDDTNKKHFLNQRVEIVLMRYEGKGSLQTKSVLDAP